MKYVLPALLIIAIGLLVFRLTTDKKKESTQVPVEMPVGIRTVKVQEVIQTTNYTYMYVKEQGQVYWIAVNKTEAAEGETYAYQTAMEQKDFTSTELDRTFETIYFVQDLFKVDASTGRPVPMEHQTNKPRTDKDETISVEKPQGGYTIAELLEDKKKLANEEVVIRGKVLKVNPMIMNRNWVHIQDGTSYDQKYDLTLTTLEDVEVGQIVTFKGKVSVDKDFGAGYFYDLIIEDATVIQE